MNILKAVIHPDTRDSKKIYERPSVRGILLRDDEILLIYTKRYNDYTLPGGGIEDDESHTEALKREMLEETGAHLKQWTYIGTYDELRPTYYEGYDAMHIASHCYLCHAGNFQLPQPEDYEIENGSEPVWVPIQEAIKHNLQVMAEQPNSMGMSIQRETFLFEYIYKNYVKTS